jgi:hypothetical protein
MNSNNTDSTNDQNDMTPDSLAIGESHQHLSLMNMADIVGSNANADGLVTVSDPILTDDGHIGCIEDSVELRIEQEEQRWEREDEDENGLPWIERTSWRKRHMYNGWTLEETLEQLGECAAVTRSHYGYRVLNTPDLGFIDVDLNLEYDTGCQRAEVLSSLRSWVVQHPGQSWRAFTTAAGMRLMRTDSPQALDDEFDSVCKLVGADDLYRELCHEQKCFRARLTPKPIRCGLEMPQWNPFDEGGDGWSYSDPDGTRLPLMIKAYEILAEQYKVCELIETVGSGIIHPDLQALVHLHDSCCKTFSDLPLEPLHRNETDGPTSMEALKFNETYRPHGLAPDLIWNVLSFDVRLGLRRLDNPAEREQVRVEHERIQQLSGKWKWSL